MSVSPQQLTERERELGAIITSYYEVTEKLKQSHDQLHQEMYRLRHELARKNKELRRRERLAALGEMAAGVAHEIRNPLGGIQVFSSLLTQDLADRPKEQTLARKITKCVSQLEGIVADILEFGRPSEPTPSCVDLASLVTETLELARGRMPDSHVVVRTTPAVEATELMVDAPLLQRALLNLIVNAMEASSSVEDGRDEHVVEIDCESLPNERIAIHISDDGPGISKELMDRVFNPFFTTKDTGTGLGLAIVHQIAESLGGSIGVSNCSPHGARFTLRLPRRGDRVSREHDESMAEQEDAELEDEVTRS